MNMQYNKIIEFKKEQLEKAKNYALSRNGTCLSSEYIDFYSKLEWSCNVQGHSNWLSSYCNIVANSSWCPQCNKIKKKPFIKIRMDY